MAFHLVIPPQQITDLAVIRDLGGDVIDWIETQFRNLKQPVLQARDLRDLVKPKLSDSQAEVVIRQLLGLCATRRRQKVSSARLLEGLRNGLQIAPQPYRWNSEELAKWEALEPRLERLLEIGNLESVAKALELSYEYHNLFQSVRLMTDVRPVFNADATGIDGAVVTQVLNIYYDSTDGDHAISLAVDETDIHRIIESCQRALVKAQTAKHYFAQKCSIAVAISGEDLNESR